MISIIIPVYNIESCKKKFLQAINSIFDQSYQDFEVVIVNDGSTDQSLQILNALAKRDPRIYLINKENGGVESARRFGLKNAHGEYIVHMDQDDLYEKHALQKMISKMEAEEADVVVGNNIRFIFNKKFTFAPGHSPSMKSSKLILHDEFMKDYYHSYFGINDFPVNIWCKMYRRSFIESIPEPPLTGQIIEDLSYNMHVLPYAKKIYVISDILYYYRWGGYTNRHDKTILNTALIGYRLKKRQIKKWNLDDSFTISTAIELLNYLNTYFYYLIIYDNVDKNYFIKEATSVFSISEVQDSIKIVKEYDKFHREHIDAMIEYDFERLYIHEKKTARSNYKKRLLKKFLLKFS